MSLERYHTLEAPQNTSIEGVKIGMRVNDFSQISAKDIIAHGKAEIKIETNDVVASAEVDYVFGETGNAKSGLSVMTTEGIEDLLKQLQDSGIIDAKQKKTLRNEVLEEIETTVNQRYALDVEFIDLTDEQDRKRAIAILDSSPKGKEVVFDGAEVRTISAQEFQSHLLMQEIEQARQARMG